MNKPIRTYDDLMQEKERLQELLWLRKTQLRSNISVLKHQYSPFINIASFVGRITTRNYRNLVLNMIVDMLVNSIIKRGLLARASWFSRLIIPFFVRNYLSNFIQRHQAQILSRIGAWVKR